MLHTICFCQTSTYLSSAVLTTKLSDSPKLVTKSVKHVVRYSFQSIKIPTYELSLHSTRRQFHGNVHIITEQLLFLYSLSVSFRKYTQSSRILICSSARVIEKYAMKIHKLEMYTQSKELALMMMMVLLFSMITTVALGRLPFCVLLKSATSSCYHHRRT